MPRSSQSSYTRFLKRERQKRQALLESRHLKPGIYISDNPAWRDTLLIVASQSRGPVKYTLKYLNGRQVSIPFFPNDFKPQLKQ
jgi:hypothetical protein